MSLVEFQEKPIVMSHIFVPMSIGFMSHVDFKKWLCRPVDFKGQEPQDSRWGYVHGMPYRVTRKRAGEVEAATGSGKMSSLYRH